MLQVGVYDLVNWKLRNCRPIQNHRNHQPRVVTPCIREKATCVIHYTDLQDSRACESCRRHTKTTPFEYQKSDDSPKRPAALPPPRERRNDLRENHRILVPARFEMASLLGQDDYTSFL